ncbi:ATPase, V1/A1 complex, subunit E [Kipferlia bialata]|uniref:ATPase, V1/A1 complex, subunit E n=1 Tax=Kipferlia bialata TaxID=797122 RepID=A0A391NRZ0_9EUKA|nr:ATPase, V1/A1 complex, subunit E [Kipferlia bialata]|eukprot:g13058.t1
MSQVRDFEQMREYIILDGEDKAEEIRAQAQEDANVQRQYEVDTELVNVRARHRRAVAAVEQEKRIKLSESVNSARLECLKARDETMDEVISQVKAQLVSITENKRQYCHLLARLIAEAAVELREKRIVVVCRKEDERVVRWAVKGSSSLPSMEGVQVVVAEEEHLAPAPSAPGQHGCLGGIIVTNQSGMIRVNNTLGRRVELAVSALLPELRATLFEDAAPVVADLEVDSAWEGVEYDGEADP